MTRTWFPQRSSNHSFESSLKNFTHYLEHPISHQTIESDVRSQLSPDFTLPDLIPILARWGIHASLERTNLEALYTAKFPALTMIQDLFQGAMKEIPVVVLGIENEEVAYIHPRKGFVYATPNDFNGSWLHTVLSCTSISGSGEADYAEKQQRQVALRDAHPKRAIAQWIKDVISPEDCAYIIALSEGKFGRSKAGEADQVVEGRTSYSAYLVLDDDPVLNAIRSRISMGLGIPEDHFEYFQCVSYGVGQEYQAHHDTFDPNTEHGRLALADGGQRMMTLLIYLNDDFEGGQTYFPYLDLLATPERGHAVLFQNTDAAGNLIVESFHAGLPVSRGQKYALNLWIREGVTQRI